MGKTVVPYKEEQAGKKEQVAKMFDNISHRYDFLNHFLSMGIDRAWRRKAIRLLRDSKPPDPGRSYRYGGFCPTGIGFES